MVLDQTEYKALVEFCIKNNLDPRLIDYTKSYLENMLILQAKARIYR